VSQVAGVLGESDDTDRYARLAETIKAAFNARWLNIDKHVYAEGAQTAQAFPLALEIVPENDRKSVIECLIKSVTEEYGNHHHTGNTGTTCLIDKLTELGYGEVMWKIVTNPTYPGWGFMVSEGATTIWESWSLIAGCGNAESMIMWATIDEFFYNDLAGIAGPDFYGPGQMTPGFKEICIRPYVPDALENAGASITTVRGRVASKWKKTKQGIELEVSIPVNSTAKVGVPKIGLADVKVEESGRNVWENGCYMCGVDGISGAMETTDHVMFEVGSGNYFFTLGTV
jgi:alpha-L-rhamnosidase